jgi:predicted nucleic acid-binding protein
MEICSEPTPIQEPLLSSLDSGEAAVIQTALHRGISRVILDERLGRGIATRLGLEVMGSLGVLVRAKRAGFLDSVSPCLERMTQAGIRISSELGRLALQQAGES